MTKHDENRMYKALETKDRRFDGQFFYGVRTTGIYCRPYCAAKPKRENVEFFSLAEDAEKAGYRPCLRCRPAAKEQSSERIVQRALEQVMEGALFEGNEEAFAESFGLSARHLRRLFLEELGVTAKQISDMQRLNFARKLVAESEEPLIDVAYQAGFQSLRRFNDAFKTRFEQTPSELRKNPDLRDGTQFSLALPYQPPLHWNAHLQNLQNHVQFGMEELSEGIYTRYVWDEENQAIAAVRVRCDETENRLLLDFEGASASSLYALTRRVRRMFDLDLDPLQIESSFSSSGFLSDLLRKHSGLRLSRAWDPFELAVSTILGQFVSMAHARMLLQQLIEAHGEKHEFQGRTVHLFPSAETIRTADLSMVKTTEARRQTLRRLCEALLNSELHFEQEQNLGEFRKKLLAIKGIGPWTAEYIALRGLGDADAFPSKDLIIARVLADHPEIMSLDLAPWRGYLTMYLWKEFAHAYSRKNSGKEKREGKGKVPKPGTRSRSLQKTD